MGQRFEKSFGANPFGDSPFQQTTNTKNAKKEGKVTIDKDAPNTRKTSKTVGEYVDFEEVD